MAKKKQQAPPPQGAQFTPVTMALMGVSLLIGLIVGYVVGAGSKDKPGADETPAAVAGGGGSRDTATPTPKKPTQPRTPPPAVSETDSPFLDAAAVAKFEGADQQLTDYKKAVSFVDRRNARAAGPILDRLASGDADAAYQEEVALLQASNKVNQNLPQEGLDAVAAWRKAYPDSRLMAQSSLIEGKAHLVKAKSLNPTQGTATGQARAEYESARDVFLGIARKYPDDAEANGEALYNLAAIYKNLGQTDQSLQTYDTLVEKYPQHRLASKALYSVANSAWAEEDIETAEKYFRKLATDYPSARESQRAKKNIDALEIIGKPAKELVVDHWLGDQETLAANRGKVVVLTFWNEWCPHCRREMPKMQQLHEKYAGQGLVVIAVTKHTKNQTDEKVQAFLDSNNITFPCAVESAGYQTTRDYGVSGVPAGVVIDRDGAVVWRNHPARLSEERLLEILGG